MLDLVAHQVLIRGVRRHDRLRQRRERLGEPMRLPRLAQLREHLVGEVAQARGCRRRSDGSVGEVRQHLRERRVVVVVALEVEQRVEQRAPLALGDADREQDQDREVGGLLDLDAAIVQVLR